MKDKYYQEIKLRPGVTQEQQKAMDFFNRYNEEQKVAEQQHETFKSNTKEYFGPEFKGFDFSVGEKMNMRTLLHNIFMSKAKLMQLKI